jgi:hypothetical protein
MDSELFVYCTESTESVENVAIMCNSVPPRFIKEDEAEVETIKIKKTRTAVPRFISWVDETPLIIQ